MAHAYNSASAEGEQTSGTLEPEKTVPEDSDSSLVREIKCSSRKLVRKRTGFPPHGEESHDDEIFAPLNKRKCPISPDVPSSPINHTLDSLTKIFETANGNTISNLSQEVTNTLNVITDDVKNQVSLNVKDALADQSSFSHPKKEENFTPNLPFENHEINLVSDQKIKPSSAAREPKGKQPAKIKNEVDKVYIISIEPIIGQPIYLQLPIDASLFDLKDAVETRFGIHPESQIITYAGGILKANDLLLEDLPNLVSSVRLDSEPKYSPNAPFKLSIRVATGVDFSACPMGEVCECDWSFNSETSSSLSQGYDCDCCESSDDMASTPEKEETQNNLKIKSKAKSTTIVLSESALSSSVDKPSAGSKGETHKLFLSITSKQLDSFIKQTKQIGYDEIKIAVDGISENISAKAYDATTYTQVQDIEIPDPSIELSRLRIVEENVSALGAIKSENSPDKNYAPKVTIQTENRMASRCHQCNRKCRPALQFTCKCGNVFCQEHRYYDLHSCPYDIKGHDQRILETANPKVVRPRV